MKRFDLCTMKKFLLWLALVLQIYSLMYCFMTSIPFTLEQCAFIATLYLGAAVVHFVEVYGK